MVTGTANETAGGAAQPVQVLKAHVALNVRDVERSIEFYRKLFGIEPSKVRAGYAKFDVQNPPLNFTLNQVAFGERGALSHMGLQVSSTADVLATRQRWADAGLFTRDEMQTDCCYATQDKTWVRDPDGNEWEAFVVLKDNLPESAACACGDKETESHAEHPAEAAQFVQAAGCCGTAAPVGINRGGGVTAEELSQPLNVCKVFEGDADNSLVMRHC